LTLESDALPLESDALPDRAYEHNALGTVPLGYYGPVASVVGLDRHVYSLLNVFKIVKQEFKR
jgi:hypothetical protein